MTDHRIRARAYELWESAGRPSGREADHWAQAEAEIRGADAKGAAQGAKTAKPAGAAD
ncbi:DUF2934 domain-containing protein, partial [Acinetobacter baumannii]|uniref:DUF2934 domain-containing protein n=1 Tax=Acinetobacter baumannii TaxID=470 RepID=UPI0013CFCB07